MDRLAVPFSSASGSARIQKDVPAVAPGLFTSSLSHKGSGVSWEEKTLASENGTVENDLTDNSRIINNDRNKTVSGDIEEQARRTFISRYFPGHSPRLVSQWGKEREN